MHDFGVTVVGENVAAKPVFSVADGTYKADQTVTITSATPDAKIYYTLDGKEPTVASGMLYDGPVKVSVPEETTAQVMLKAIAMKDGMQNSNVATANYTIQKAWSIVTGTVHATEDRYITGYNRKREAKLEFHTNHKTFDGLYQYR